jgi:hypothetical protein
VLDNFIELRRQPYAAYRTNLRTAGDILPADLRLVVAAVTAFADGLAKSAYEGTTWNPRQRQWA